ncbi:MAG: uroporphyrinogen-III C-methyltransferase [Xanthomonadales bacterium]|nr:uroporphyrinogen-III C-methyltransferase [Xanthomonadales bacterium]
MSDSHRLLPRAHLPQGGAWPSLRRGGHAKPWPDCSRSSSIFAAARRWWSAPRRRPRARPPSSPPAARRSGWWPPVPGRRARRSSPFPAPASSARASDRRLLRGCALVLVADGGSAEGRRAVAAARRRGIPCSVIDDPLRASAHWPAVLRRGPLCVAVSTGGEAPALAGLLRARLEAAIGPEWGGLAALLAAHRERLRRRLPDPAARRRLAAALLEGELGQALRAGREDRAAALLEAALGGTAPEPRGSVALVGAGPGDPELLTLAALRELELAEVVLHDRLVPAPILALARPEAERIAVGRRCGEPPKQGGDAIARMIELARAGRRVLRLKGGDPLLFARATEELEALAAAGVPFRIVPGVTAALGCAAAAGIPLTRRGGARALLLASAHDPGSLETLPPPGAGLSLALYMGLRQAGAIAARLRALGWDAATPVAVVAAGTLPEQRVLLTELGRLEAALAAHPLPPPATLLVGAQAALAARFAWRGQPPVRDPVPALARAA